MTSMPSDYPASDETTRRKLRTWLAAALVMTLLGAATGMLYFAAGGIFAPVSDAVAAIMGLTQLPVALGLHSLFRPSEPRLSRRARLLGLTGLGIMIAGSVVLVFSGLGFDALPGPPAFATQVVGIFIQGAWLCMIGVLGYRTTVFERRTGHFAIMAGGGYLLFVIGSLSSALAPLSGVGGLAGVIGFCVWAISSRRDLRT
jgi:hypothetical protein